MNSRHELIHTYIYTCCCFYFWKIVLEGFETDFMDFSANNKTEFIKIGYKISKNQFKSFKQGKI